MHVQVIHLLRLLVVVPATSAPVQAEPNGKWVSSFSGKGLLGWHIAEYPDSIKVQ